MVLAVASWASAVNAADVVVSSCTKAGFAAAFNSANGSGGGTITFSCTGTIAVTSAYQVNSALRIDGGNKITFDGGNSTSLFYVNNGKSLTLLRLHLQHAAAGAAVDNYYGSVTVAESTFDHNSAGAFYGGGAIHSNGGDLAIYSTTFTSNSAGIGGAIENFNGPTYVFNSTFTGNTASDGGGAIWSNFLISAVSSTFTTNQSSAGEGGAISGGPTLFVDRSQFTGNTAGTTGGAINFAGDAGTIAYSTFAANHSGQHGGAVYSEGALTLGNATFQGNSVLSGATYAGGAIYETTYSPSQANTVTYVTVSGNGAPSLAGGIYHTGASGSLTVGHSIIAGNSGGNCGGTLVTGGYNLADDSGCAGFFGGTDKSNAALPLATLANNGGPTLTMLPLPGNQAINFVPPANCGYVYDQRGGVRPAGGNCDSGAVELNAIIDEIFQDGFQFR